MASRSLKPDPPSTPKRLNEQMRQGEAQSFDIPHGLSATMRQGTQSTSEPNPNGPAAAMRQRSSKK